jgi:hypothetical protein
MRDKMTEKNKYPVAFITTHPGGRLSTFLIEEVSYCGNGRAKVTIEAPCSFLEENDDTKYIECVYDRDFNEGARLVCSKVIFEGKNLAVLSKDEKIEVYTGAASKLTAAIQSIGKTNKKFEVILKCQK